MDYLKLRGIEKAAGLKAARGYEIPPVLATDCKVEAPIARPERAIRTVHVARRLQVETGPRRNVDDQGSLVAVLGRGNPVDSFQRLHRPDGNLVREGLALLVSDGLSVHGEGIFLMLAQAVHEAVGIGCHARSSHGD